MAILLLLQGRRLVRGEEIASHFEISLRTVYRDVAALSEAGVPVVAEAGVGYSLLKGYSMPPVMFTPEEAGALFLGGELVNHLTDPSLEGPMRSALLKIRAVLPRAQQDRLDRLEGTTALMMRRPPDPDAGGSGKAALITIQEALARRRVLEIDYRKPGIDAATRRAIEPLGLIYYADHWHLIAYCRWRGDVRDFRLDRILDLRLTGEEYAGRGEFSLRDHLDSWRERARSEPMVVRLEEGVVDRFRRAWMGGIASERREADRWVMEVMAGDCEWLARWLLSFGTALEVLAPESLRRRMAESARELARHHGAGG